jgi:type VII secretion-associated protein (TIGR03931 family)
VSGTPVRVAVQLGAATARVAAAGADGEPWLVAQTPARGTTVASLLAELAPGPEELVLVHPPSWTALCTASWVDRCGGLAGHVRAVPAPVAAAGRRDVAVLDVGHRAAEATRLDAAGHVLAVRSRAVAGAALDAVLTELLGLPADDPAARAEARRVREALSLLPAVQAGAREPVLVTAVEVRPLLVRQLAAAVDALREVLLQTGPAPVLLVGGMARTPLLAELVDEAGIADIAEIAVAPRPDAAAVLGALVLPDMDRHPRSVQVAVAGRTPCRGSRVAAPGSGAGPGRSAAPVARRLPPPPARVRSPLRVVLLIVAAAVVIAGLLGVGVLLPSRPQAVAVPDGVLVQYGYRLDIPSGWEHTGGLPERRRTLLTPAGSPEGSDLIAVERSPLGYDTGAEPERARAELHAEFEEAVAGGSALRDYATTTVAGREVATYRQRGTDGRTVVDWFVLLDGDAQLSVGCRHTAAGSVAVRAACDVVVASVRRA